MIDLQTVLTYLTLISVPVGVFYHIMTLRNTKKNQELTLKSQQQATETRQAQLFMGLYEVYRSRDFRIQYYTIRQWEWENYDDFVAKYGPLSNIEAASSHMSVMGFFEGVGMLVRRGLIEIEMVEDLLDILLFGAWDHFESMVKETRIRQNLPQFFANYEYLVNQIRSQP